MVKKHVANIYEECLWRGCHCIACATWHKIKRDINFKIFIISSVDGHGKKSGSRWLWCTGTAGLLIVTGSDRRFHGVLLGNAVIIASFPLAHCMP